MTDIAVIEDPAGSRRSPWTRYVPSCCRIGSGAGFGGRCRRASGVATAARRLPPQGAAGPRARHRGRPAPPRRADRARAGSQRAGIPRLAGGDGPCRHRPSAGQGPAVGVLPARSRRPRRPRGRHDPALGGTGRYAPTDPVGRRRPAAALGERIEPRSPRSSVRRCARSPRDTTTRAPPTGAGTASSPSATHVQPRRPVMSEAGAQVPEPTGSSTCRSRSRARRRRSGGRSPPARVSRRGSSPTRSPSTKGGGEDELRADGRAHREGGRLGAAAPSRLRRQRRSADGTGVARRSQGRCQLCRPVGQQRLRPRRGLGQRLRRHEQGVDDPAGEPAPAPDPLPRPAGPGDRAGGNRGRAQLGGVRDGVRRPRRVGQPRRR